MEPLHKLPANWQLFFFIINATGMALVAFMLVGVYEWIVAKTEANLTIEYDRAEGLLRNILPDAIATKLKDSPELIAEEHKQVSVLFADIVNFTATSSKLTKAACDSQETSPTHAGDGIAVSGAWSNHLAEDRNCTIGFSSRRRRGMLGAGERNTICKNIVYVYNLLSWHAI